MKKAIALFTMLTIALSIVGLVYAHWSDTIYINGYVQAGTLNLAFQDTPYETYEFTRKPDGTLDPTEGGKPWVCNTTYGFDKFVRDCKTNKTGYRKLWINITNGYPCYEVHQTFIVHNIGSIPLDVVDYEITDPTGELVWVQDTAYTGFRGDLVDNSTGLEIPIINIEIVNAKLPWQLDPCWSNKMEIDLHIKQEALQCHDYLVEVGIVYEQWDP